MAASTESSSNSSGETQFGLIPGNSYSVWLDDKIYSPSRKFISSSVSKYGYLSLNFVDNRTGENITLAPSKKDNWKFKDPIGSVSPTVIKSIARQKGIPPDVETRMKKFGGRKSRRNKSRHTKKKTSHRRR
jgi:hypothetical protein